MYSRYHNNIERNERRKRGAGSFFWGGEGMKAGEGTTSHLRELTEPAALNKYVLKQHKVLSTLTASRDICQSDSAAFSLGNNNWKFFEALYDDLRKTISKSKEC